MADVGLSLAERPAARRAALGLRLEEATEASGVAQARDFDRHERVVRCRDAACGLNAVVALHDLTLGPALGGCRVVAHRTAGEAVGEALRIARNGTRRAALAGLSLGGGAAIVIGSPRTVKSPALFRAFGRAIDRLTGSFIATCDQGLTPHDLDFAAMETPFVVGASPGGGGDPSLATAYGVYLAIGAAVRHRLGRQDLKDLDVSIQGVGRVGYALAALLHRDGARLVVADRDEEALGRAVGAFGAAAASVHDIHRVRADVLAPCAGSGALDARAAAELGAAIVCGGADGVLAGPEVAEKLHAQGVLYIPDYLANAGGLVNAAAELDRHGYEREAAMRRIGEIGQRTHRILAMAEAEGVAPGVVADRLADERVRAGRRTLRLASRTPAWAHA